MELDCSEPKPADIVIKAGRQGTVGPLPNSLGELHHLMRSHVVARKTHKWLGLFVGLQAVLWSLSGVYMTVVHIDTIHGDHFVRHQQPPGVAAATLRDPIALFILRCREYQVGLDGPPTGLHPDRQSRRASC